MPLELPPPIAAHFLLVDQRAGETSANKIAVLEVLP